MPFLSHSRLSLRILAILAPMATMAAAASIDPHLDSTLVPSGCPACHESHGLSGSPMLGKPQEEICMSCHGSPGGADMQVMRGNLVANSETQFLSTTFALPYSHPITEGAFSRREKGVVTCSSCHSPHRSPTQSATETEKPGEIKVSTRATGRSEFHLCQECHGMEGIYTEDLTDISRLTNTSNSSFHPIEGPAPARTPSVRPELSGQVINCTDCHGSSNAAGPKGPHGSEFRYILKREYLTTDGAQESVRTYALCYGCHDRQSLFEASLFPQHESHVARLRISCATCHNPHGSVDNRALIRFGEETGWGGVSPTLRTGRIDFESLGAGAGACWVNCHGTNHEPATYGEGGELMTLTAPELIPDPLSPMSVPEAGIRAMGGLERERRKPPPPK